MARRTFASSVAIWKGFRPITNGGLLVMRNNFVRLYDGKGRMIGEGRTTDTYATPRRGTWSSGMSVWIGGQKFMLSPGSGNPPPIRAAPGLDPTVGRVADALTHGIEFAHNFYDALEAAGGHRGAPPKP